MVSSKHQSTRCIAYEHGHHNIYRNERLAISAENIGYSGEKCHCCLDHAGIMHGQTKVQWELGCKRIIRQETHEHRTTLGATCCHQPSNKTKCSFLNGYISPDRAGGLRSVYNKMDITSVHLDNAGSWSVQSFHLVFAWCSGEIKDMYKTLTNRSLSVSCSGSSRTATLNQKPQPHTVSC